MKRGFNNKGQVTIFIIAAVVVVAVGILIYISYPQIRINLGIESQNPAEYIQSCISEDIVDSVNKLSIQGGSLEPSHYIVYNNQKIEYLCYTSEYYKTCVVQQPMLKRHIEKEVKADIEDKVKTCFDDLEESYQKKGYEVNLRYGDFDVELLPKRIAVTFNNSITLTKESSETYDSISAMVNNNLYELVSITNSIINWETSYGDAETTTYMNYYHDLRVEKKLQSDGTTIYVLTDLNNGNKFQFASRSVAWPPGYGIDEVLG
ncbi:MAG: hypothetical protein ABIJ14_01695 [Nanoarchaeota archaeon]